MKYACLLTILLLAPAAMAQTPPQGERVYRERCAGCHDQTTQRIPPKAALQKMPATKILRVLDFGVMMSVAYPLKRDDREAVAKYLGTDAGDAQPPARAYCGDRTVRLKADTTSAAATSAVATSAVATSAVATSAAATSAAARVQQWNGWSPASTNTRFQTAANAGLTAAQVPSLELKWAFAFDGDVSTFNQPTVIGPYLFVGGASGAVYALDTKSGCIHWNFQANGPVRSSLLLVKDRLIFSDLVGWTYALDASTGGVIWKVRPEEHEATRLTGGAVEANGVVFIPVASWEESRALGPEYECCTFRGSIVALRASDGQRVWKTYMIDGPATLMGKTSKGTNIYGPSGAGVWSSPTIDTRRGVLYIATGDNYSTPPTKTSDALMALDIKTGKILWVRQITSGDAYNSGCGNDNGQCPAEKGPDFDFGSSAMLVRAGGRDLVVAGQKSGVVTAVDPAREGQIVWQTRVGKGGVNGGVQWGMASDGTNVYASVSDVVRLPNTNPQPGDTARFVLSKTEGGGISALKLTDGGKVWAVAPPPCRADAPRGCSPSQSAALSAIPGLVFSGSLDGHLRAFDVASGKVVWEVDTVRDYDAVNGVKGRGGSMDGPGAVIAGGMLFVNSGYSRFDGMPGNVLLAFGLK
ncbi:MAG TPA: PQQ-binding-like beta-propeller repeat protein [Vicinamibacterales bacterium]|nr:PQQ-binding-like beta-propeller repeat protein [Vicinamibacterales bacterium]